MTGTQGLVTEICNRISCQGDGGLALVTEANLDSGQSSDLKHLITRGFLRAYKGIFANLNRIQQY